MIKAAPAAALSLVAVMVMVMMLAGPAFAQAPRHADAEAVVAAQLEAFARDDGAAAFAIASPDIQRLFGDAGTFMAMVRQGYPQVYRAKSHRFLRAEAAPGGLRLRVLLESPTGTVVAIYELVEVDNRWRINGCLIEPGSDT